MLLTSYNIGEITDICQKMNCWQKLSRQQDHAVKERRISMPRPRKCRKVCSLPGTPEFIPVNGNPEEDAVILTVDQYETIRLIDKEGFSQEECGEYMHIARTTVQQIYTCARKAIADALVDGLTLRIEGGSYRLCDGQEQCCDCGGCAKHRRK